MAKKIQGLRYFEEREEKAVIEYILSDSLEEKNRIYNEILLKPFNIMKETILRRYPIHIGNYDMNEVESNALVHLVDHMVKYRPFIIERKADDAEKWNRLGEAHRFIYEVDAEVDLYKLSELDDDYTYRMFAAKAYSYCQTIIRNYYKDHSKKSYTEKKTNLCFDDFADEINERNDLTYEMELENQHQLEKLINSVVKKIDFKIDNDPNIKKNEIIVGDAIANVLKNWQVLFMEDSPDGKYNKRVTNKFAKNKILLFLKEQTGLSTKEIRIGIKPFKEIYFIEKIDYMED